jgi:hypothetical protein
MPGKPKPCRMFLLKNFELTEFIEILVAPLDLVETHIRRYHSQGVSFDRMVVFLRKDYDTVSYGLGYVSSCPTL